MNVQEYPPVQDQQNIPANPLDDFDAVRAAESILAAENVLEDIAAQPGVVEGAENYLREVTAEQTATPEATVEPEVAIDPALLKMFMFLSQKGADPEARKAVVTAMAIDVIGQKNDIKEMTFANAREQNENAHAAQMAASDRERIAKELKELEDDKEDKN